ncbi:hypothetical protein H2248_003110 [Termitomyces sp. 'cryptogamus']|nr:hypothetical protein H2248_003110 [Termitomyces sp. 'cryptogamus']
MCRESFIPNSAVKLIIEGEASESGCTEQAAIDLLKKLIISWSLELSELDRIALVMEVEQSLESNGNAHEVLIKTLEIVRAQNKLSHELEQINVAHALLKEEASAIEQSLSTKLKEVQCRFTLDLPDRERDILAKALKEDGNRAYESEEFTLAVSFYSRAIETSSKYDATFYANRAACYLRMTPQVPHLAVQDCSEAIQHSPTYVKAIHRRGTAYEILERFDDALDDFITTTSLDLTGITKDLGSVDRLLKKFATEKASEILDNKDTSLPPFSVASTYFASFRAQTTLDIPARLSAGDIALLKSLEAISLADYQSAMLLVNEALDRGISISWRQGRATARNLRGTFKRVSSG